jgi:DNA (cytosine-5)-methyltransferase 1
MVEKRYISVREASKMLGVTPLTLRNWDKAGKLMALRNPLNNYRVYRKEEIDFFLRKMEAKGKIMMG